MSETSVMAPLSALIEVNPTERFARKGAVPFIGMDDVSNDGRLLRVRERGARKTVGCSTFRNGDVLLAKITPCLENGKGVLVSGIDGVGLGSTEFHVLRPKPGVSSSYIYHWSRHLNFRRAAEARMIGSAGQRRVPARFLDEFLVPYIDSDEQRRIAEILDTVDDQVWHVSEIRNKAELVVQGLVDEIMKSMISDQLYRCVDVFKLSSGRPLTGRQVQSGREAEFPAFGGNGIVGYVSTPFSMSPTFVIGRVGEYCGTVRYTYRSAWITDNALWANWVHPEWEKEFVALYLEWFDLRRVTSRTGQPLITQQVIGQVPIPKPGLAEQQAVVQQVAGGRSFMRVLEQETEKLKLVKRDLMEDLLTGKVRVTRSGELTV